MNHYILLVYTHIVMDYQTLCNPSSHSPTCNTCYMIKETHFNLLHFKKCELPFNVCWLSFSIKLAWLHCHFVCEDISWHMQESALNKNFLHFVHSTWYFNCFTVKSMFIIVYSSWQLHVKRMRTWTLCVAWQKSSLARHWSERTQESHVLSPAPGPSCMNSLRIPVRKLILSWSPMTHNSTSCITNAILQETLIQALHVSMADVSYFIGATCKG